MNNLACRIFKEQIDLLLSLPDQEEAKTVLYQAVVSSYKQIVNQFDNQNENQFDYAYVSDSDSVSLSVLSKNILSLLSKNIQWKEFSNNYGGRRENSGRKPQSNQIENQVASQVASQNENSLNNMDKSKNLSGSLSNAVSLSLEIKPDKKEKYKEKFEDFWQLYTPVKCDGRFVDKGSKKTAFEKFVKILEKGENYENIIRGTKQYIEHCRANNQLTCGVTVFLNQERWINDYGTTLLGEDARGKQQGGGSVLQDYARVAYELGYTDNFHG